MTVLPEDRIIPIDTDASEVIGYAVSDSETDAERKHRESLERDDAFDKPWSEFTGMERVHVRQRVRHGESHHELADAAVRGHENDWAAQEAAGLPVYKRRHVLVFRAPVQRKPRKRERGEFTKALSHLCGLARNPRRTFEITTDSSEEHR